MENDAWLNCRYDQAELCAQRALVLDPQFTRARYRRGLACKGNFELTKAALGTSSHRASHLA
jgi:hypothetical protein